MYVKVFDFMNKKELIYKYMFVIFRNSQHNKHSIDKIIKSLDSGIDFLKAFATVNHTIKKCLLMVFVTKY